MQDLSEVLSTAVTAVRRAADIIQRMRSAATISNKSATELVTAADINAQSAILDVIRSLFPNHPVLGEEGLTDADREAPHLWIVDPLDGTHNYIHGIPHYSVSVAYAQRGVVCCGVVMDVCRNELFTATAEGPALLNGMPIRPSSRADLSGAIIATGFYYERGPTIEATLRSLDTLFSAGIGDIRRSGSAALDLCWVACGRYDGYFEYRLSPWDFSAGMLICSQANAICTDLSGAPARISSKGIVATNSLLHAAVLSAISTPF